MKFGFTIVAITSVSCASTTVTQMFTPPRLDVSCLSYDRKTLLLLVLVEATSDNTLVDRRMTPNAAAGIKWPVRDCKTDQPVKYFVADTFEGKPTSNDMLTLREGEFFGRALSFVLFMDDGPECIDTTVVFSMTRLDDAGSDIHIEHSVVARAGVQRCGTDSHGDGLAR